MSTPKELRAQLTASLEKLGRMRALDLVREDTLGPKLNFRSGIPVFEKTLSFYRQVAAADLTRTPSPILAIANEHVERSLAQFESIEAFDPNGVERPEQLRNLLISEIAASHAALYEDLCILLAPSSTQAQKPERRGLPVRTMAVLALIAAAVFAQYRFSVFDGVVEQISGYAHHLTGNPR